MLVGTCKRSCEPPQGRDARPAAGRVTKASHYVGISRPMDLQTALDAFSALAQPTRLRIFQRLIKAYPDPLPAGHIARLCKVPHNTMSTHLAALKRAGLIAVRREGRTMNYSANLPGLH